MNHIHKLQDDLLEAKREILRLRAGIFETIGYLNSPKFSQGDPFVERGDVIERLREWSLQRDQAEFEHARIDGRLWESVMGREHPPGLCYGRGCSICTDIVATMDTRIT